MSELKTEYFDNGNRKSEQYYKDGKQEGKWTEWDENGKKVLEENYKNGQKVEEE